MKLIRQAGTTSQTLNLFIADSSSATGAGLTGLVYNAAGLTAYYARPGAAAAAITLATQTPTGAWSSGGFCEISAANMPGWYRFDVPDACLAAGADSVAIHLKGATNMAPLPLELDLAAAAHMWDLLNGIETNITPRLALRYIAAVLVGDISTADQANEIYKAIGNPGTTRLNYPVDATGNRTSVVLS